MEKPQVKDVLLILGIGAVVLSSLVTPGLPKIIYYLTRQNKQSAKKLASFNHRLFRQGLRRLAKRDLIKFREVNGKTIAELTDQGKTRLIKYHLDELKIEQPEKWDGKWRLVIFDIPNNKKTARDFLRLKLKSLGFYPLQESVFIHPFPCQQEIMILRENFELTGEEVMYLTVERIEGKKISLYYFK